MAASRTMMRHFIALVLMDAFGPELFKNKPESEITDTSVGEPVRRTFLPIVKNGGNSFEG